MKRKFHVRCGSGEKLEIISKAYLSTLDRSDIRVKHISKEKSYGNTQVLTKDYVIRSEIEVVLREISEQVATRLRKHHVQAGCVSIMVGYSRTEDEKGFNRQLKIPFTNNTKVFVAHCLHLFDTFYEEGRSVRNLGVSCSKLKEDSNLQLDLFKKVEEEVNEKNLDGILDTIRSKFGFSSLVHASSLSDGATAIKRSALVGGHASGEGKRNDKPIQ